MNSKNDWAQPPLVRIVAVTGNQLETQIGDNEPSRQERRAARQPGTPGGQRRMRRRQVDDTVEDSPVRRITQHGDREARIARRERNQE
jgi:hypothetical protein